MSKKSGSGSGPFLMEMLVVVGFFIICASICVMVLAKADSMSRRARDMNQAALKAQSLAESMKAGQEPAWSSEAPEEASLVLPEGLKEGQELRYLYWDRSWEETGSLEDWEYAGIFCEETQDHMREGTIWILCRGSGESQEQILMELPISQYQKP